MMVILLYRGQNKSWISQIAIVGKRRMEYRYVEQPTTGRGTTIKISLVPASSIRHSAFVVKTGTGTWRAHVSWNVVGTVVLTSRHESLRNERTTKLEKYLRLIVLRASREIQQGEEIFFLKHIEIESIAHLSQFFVLLRFET